MWGRILNINIYNPTDFERIATYLREEDSPKTPQEIHKYTGIKLENVYDVLQNNRVFFKEIFDGDFLKGWINRPYGIM